MNQRQRKRFQETREEKTQLEKKYAEKQQRINQLEKNTIALQEENESLRKQLHAEKRKLNQISQLSKQNNDKTNAPLKDSPDLADAWTKKQIEERQKELGNVSQKAQTNQSLKDLFEQKSKTSTKNKFFGKDGASHKRVEQDTQEMNLNTKDAKALLEKMLVISESRIRAQKDAQEAGFSKEKLHQRAQKIDSFFKKQPEKTVTGDQEIDLSFL